MKIQSLLRTREIDLHNDRISQISDHLWRSTKDLNYAVMKYNAETGSSILINEIAQLNDIRKRLLNVIEDIETSINEPF